MYNPKQIERVEIQDYPLFSTTAKIVKIFLKDGQIVEELYYNNSKAHERFNYVHSQLTMR